MPGIFEGGSAERSDAVRIARHLSGAERLPAQLLAIADFDRNGTVGAADLLHAVRLVAGLETGAVSTPELEVIDPSPARAGERIRIRGEALAGTRAFLVAGNETFAPATTVVSATELDVDLPPAAELIRGASASIHVSVFAVRGAVRSNGMPLHILAGPVITEVGRAAQQLLFARGRGFGTDPARIAVYLDGGRTNVTSLSAGQVVIQGPVSSEVSVTVEVDGVGSNTLRYIPNRAYAGRVELPAGSTLDVASLQCGMNGVYVPVQADGTFHVSGAPRSSATVFHGGEPILSAVLADQGATTIDARSTAIAIVFDTAGAARLAPSSRAAFLAALETSPAVGAFAAKIEERHAAAPHWKDLFEDAATREALSAAATAGRGLMPSSD